MTTAEDKFKHALQVFRIEAQESVQTLYAYLTIHAVMGESESVTDAINETQLFWGTCLNSLQTSLFIVLGRIFDRKSKHNLFALLGYAEKNPKLFSLESLATRKREASANADDWLEEYLARAHVPGQKDFRRLRRRANHYAKIYHKNYRLIRHRIHAHKEVTEPEKIRSLYSKTRIRELENTVVYLNKLYQCLYDLYVNGREPRLSSMPYSVQSIRHKRIPTFQSALTQQQTVKDTEDTLRMVEIGLPQIQKKRDTRDDWNEYLLRKCSNR